MSSAVHSNCIYVCLAAEKQLIRTPKNFEHILSPSSEFQHSQRRNQADASTSGQGRNLILVSLLSFSLDA